MDSFSFDEQSGFRVAQQTRRAEQAPRPRSNLRDPTRSFGTNEWWPCKSQASSDCPAFGIAAVVDITTIPNEDRPVILVDQPSTTFRRQYVVIGPDGLKKNDYGACTFGPRVRVAYDSSATPSFDDGWGPKAGQWTITKNYPSAISIVGVADSSVKHAFGLLSPINSVIGKLAASLSVGGSATVNIYGGSGGSEAIISSLTLSGRDWLMTSGETALPSSTKVQCTWIDGIWYIVGLEATGGAIGIGKTAAAIAKGASGTINTYSDASTSTGNTITATNLFGDVGSGKWVSYAKVGSTYYLIAAEC